MFRIETERCYLRNITVDDALFAYALNADAEVLRYTGDEPFPDVESAAIFLKNYNDYKTFGYGRWMVVLKHNNEAIGWCGLKNQMEELQIVDIGYRFFRKHWGCGFATETASACVEWAFLEKKIPHLTGRVAIGNDASEKVLKKLGFLFEKNDVCHDQHARWFKLTRNQWLTNMV